MKILAKIRNLFSPSIARQLSICEFNLENLFISLEHQQDGDWERLSESEWRQFALPQLRKKQKPLSKLWGLSSAILDINPDILMLVEVGGKESLEHFNTHFLKGAYQTHFVETNSSRSIDLAFLVKKDLSFSARAISNRDAPVKIDGHRGSGMAARFSRDVAELHLYSGEQLKLILLLTHLKSKISTDTDFQGRSRRRAEAEGLATIYKKIRQKNKNVGVVVGGDLNSDLRSPELEPVAKTDLIDFHELLGTEEDARTSLIYFDQEGKPNAQVLDYLFISPHLKTKVVKNKSFTYRYKSFYDIPHPLPTTIKERFQMPSDHFPLVLTLEI